MNIVYFNLHTDINMQRINENIEDLSRLEEFPPSTHDQGAVQQHNTDNPFTWPEWHPYCSRCYVCCISLCPPPHHCCTRRGQTGKSTGISHLCWTKERKEVTSLNCEEHHWQGWKLKHCVLPHKTYLMLETNVINLHMVPALCPRFMKRKRPFFF